MVVGCARFISKLRSMPGYEELKVWQRSMELIAECYRVSATFPRAEQFGLTIQLRRAAISVAANIAEGNGRWHRKEYLHHLSISRGSLNEAETYLRVAVMLAYATTSETGKAYALAKEVSRMLTGLRRRLLKP
jgi:four helix bundle protein